MSGSNGFDITGAALLTQPPAHLVGLTPRQDDPSKLTGGRITWAQFLALLPAGLKGADGAAWASAYALAVQQGYTGTLTQWLASLKGTKGDQGLPGNQGDPGAPGLSAYDLAVANGYTGTEAEWLLSLRGSQGSPGAAGLSAYQVAQANGFTGTQAEWLASLKGAKGDQGTQGIQGIQGAQGTPGASAYAVAVANGFSGTEAQWLASLKGAQGLQGLKGDQGTQGVQGNPGLSAYQVAVAAGFTGTEAQWLATLVGPQGEKGEDGIGLTPRGDWVSGTTYGQTDYVFADDGAGGTAMFVRRGTGDYVSTTAPASDAAHWYAFTVQQGPPGNPGTDGAPGASAYQIALQNGFVGTEAQWLASLKGADGTNGTNGVDGQPGIQGPAGTVTAPSTTATDRTLTVFGVWENGTWRNLPYATLRDWLAEDIGSTTPPANGNVGYGGDSAIYGSDNVIYA